MGDEWDALSQIQWKLIRGPLAERGWRVGLRPFVRFDGSIFEMRMKTKVIHADFYREQKML
jgi:hypothetical protein